MATLLQPALRIRKDILLLLIGMVALVGGVVVYRSFAGKKVSTINPGTVPAAQINTGFAPAFTLWPVRTTHYQFAVQAGLQYCFWGAHNSGVTITAQVTQAGAPVPATVPASKWPAADEPLVCFTPAASAETQATVTFSGDGQVSFLHIEKP